MSTYQPKHAKPAVPVQLPGALRGLADLIEAAGSQAYEARHARG